MFLPRFSGDGNPDRWIFRAELYFTYLGFDEVDWLPLPLFYLDGEALVWFDWLFRNKLFFDWKHFKGKFAQRFRDQTNNNVLGLHANSSLVHFDCDNSVPIVSQSVVVSPVHVPSHFPASSALDSAYETINSKANHVFDKLPETSKNVDSLALITESNTETQVLDDKDSPHIGNAKLVEVATLVSEPFSFSEDKVFDEMSQIVSSDIHDLNSIVHEGENFATTAAKVCDNSFCEAVSLQTKVPNVVLYDAKESNAEEEDNPRENVALFDNCPKRDTSIFLVSFPSQGTVLLKVSMRYAAVECPFDGVLCYHTIPCLHYSLEAMCGDKQTRVLPYLDFSLHKCNWVDTGQECNRPSFLSSNSRRCDSEEKIQEVLQEIIVSSFKKSPYTRVVRLLFAIFGLVHKARLTSPYIVFDPGPYLDYAATYGIDSTFRDGKSVEKAVTVLFECPSAKFPAGQVLSVQIGITSNVFNRLGTYVCCHMRTFLNFQLESDVILWMVPFCSPVDNWLDTGHDDLGELYDCRCDGGVEMDIQSYGGCNTSCETYKLLGESIKNSLMCPSHGVTTHVLKQFNAPVVQSDICAYTHGNILVFSLGRITLWGWTTRSGVISFRALPQSTPAEKSEEEDSGELIDKRIIVSLLEKLEFYVAAILKLPVLVNVTSFMASFVDMYTNLEAMAHVKAIFYTTRYRAFWCNTSNNFLWLLQHKELGNSWIHGSTCWTGLTLWLDIHNSFSFPESNLEDKVLIEGGSIVVNRVGSVKAYGLELLKKPDSVGIIGPGLPVRWI